VNRHQEKIYWWEMSIGKYVVHHSSLEKRILKQDNTCSIAKLWKQPRCPTIDEWIKKMWFIHNGVFLNRKEERNYVV
jgi:hypothetical protein